MARAAEIELSLCGQMAYDPLVAPLLVGLGIEERSMDPHSGTSREGAPRAVSPTLCRDVAREAMTLASAEEIEELLKRSIGPSIAHLRARLDKRRAQDLKHSGKR